MSEQYCRVYVRCKLSHERPLWRPEGHQLVNTEEQSERYTFSGVLTEGATHKELYDEAIAPRIQTLLLQGGQSAVTVLSYGPACSGKSHTVFGTAGQTRVREGARGVAYRCGQQLLSALEGDEATLTLSLIQVFADGRVADLFDTRKRSMEVGAGHWPPSATQQRVASSQELLRIIEKGYLIRNATGCVKEPQRKAGMSFIKPLPLQQYRPHASHAMFHYTVHQRSSDEHVIASTATVVDLAGRSIATPSTDPGVEALNTLLNTQASGSVVSEPNTSLTKLLAHSLGGSCNTVVIANLSLSSAEAEHLQLLSSITQIKNRPAKTVLIPISESELFSGAPSHSPSVSTDSLPVRTAFSNSIPSVRTAPLPVVRESRPLAPLRTLPPVKPTLSLKPTSLSLNTAPPSPLFAAVRARSKPVIHSSSEDSLESDSSDDSGSAIFPLLTGPPPPPLRGIPHFNPDSPLSSQLTATPLIPSSSVTSRPSSASTTHTLNRESDITRRALFTLSTPPPSTPPQFMPPLHTPPLHTPPPPTHPLHTPPLHTPPLHTPPLHTPPPSTPPLLTPPLHTPPLLTPPPSTPPLHAPPPSTPPLRTPPLSTPPPPTRLPTVTPQTRLPTLSDTVQPPPLPWQQTTPPTQQQATRSSLQRSEGSLADVSHTSSSSLSLSSSESESRDQFNQDMQARALAINTQGYTTRRVQLPPLEQPPSYPGYTTPPVPAVTMDTSGEVLSGGVIHTAALEGVRAGEMKRLALQYGVDCRDQGGRTPLMYAVLGNQPKMCEQLIKLRANIDVKDSSGQTPLLWATFLARAEVVRVLLKGGADASYTDVSGRSAFHWAMRTPNIHPLKWLCKYANRTSLVDLVDKEGLTALHWAVMADLATHITHVLTTTRADVSIRDSEARPPLTYAVLNFSPACIRAILEVREEAVNLTDYQGRTALHYACAEGSADCVRTLLSFRRSNVHCADDNGTTPLHWAAAGNQPGLVQLLIRRGADRAQCDGSGRTALDHAQERGHNDCMRALHTYGLQRQSSSLSLASHIAPPSHGGAPPTYDQQGHVILQRPNEMQSLFMPRLPADGQADRMSCDQNHTHSPPPYTRYRHRLVQLLCCHGQRNNVVAPL